MGAGAKKKTPNGAGTPSGVRCGINHDDINIIPHPSHLIQEDDCMKGKEISGHRNGPLMLDRGSVEEALTRDSTCSLLLQCKNVELESLWRDPERQYPIMPIFELADPPAEEWNRRARELREGREPCQD